MKAKKRYAAHYYVDGIKNSDRYILAQAISLIESQFEADKILAEEILQAILPFSGKSIRIGISGVPGAGKSTFIENFGQFLIKKGKKCAVLAVDPSSSISGGSILGDKTRMEYLASSNQAFIRPSPAAGTLGGVALKTREAIFLCEAASYDCIFVETVGVGQSETYVKEMVDFFLLITISGAGDELQGLKRGIMEMADGIVINKADGDNLSAVKETAIKLKSVIQYIAKAVHQQDIFVLEASALHNIGFDDIWLKIESFFNEEKNNLFYEKNRNEQIKKWYKETILQSLEHMIFSEPLLRKHWEQLLEKVLKNEISISEAKRKMERTVESALKGIRYD